MPLPGQQGNYLCKPVELKDRLVSLKESVSEKTRSPKGSERTLSSDPTRSKGHRYERSKDATRSKGHR